MTPVLKPIADSFHTTNLVLALCLGDLKGDDATKRTRDGDGPSIAWQVGHMLEFRCMALQLLGGAKERSKAVEDTAAGSPDGGTHPDLTTYQREWEQINAALDAALQAAAPELLERIVDDKVHGEKTVLESLVFLTWHEAYHVGGLTAIRKQFGYPGPAELNVARVAS